MKTPAEDFAERNVQLCVDECRAKGANIPHDAPGYEKSLSYEDPRVQAWVRWAESPHKFARPDLVDADPVSRPAHYTRLQPEPRDVIVAWGLNWNRGSAVAYIARAGHKVNEVEDLEKAIECLRHEVEFLKKARPRVGSDTGIL